MTVLVQILLLLLALPAAGMSGYLLFLTLLSSRAPAPPRSRRPWRFDVVVPAHDEAEGIAAVVDSLRALAWPATDFRVLVVADNCTDTTAERARAAGAVVLERQDLGHRGKGYAVASAFATSRALAWADAVVVIDADSRVTPNLLEACAARLDRGAAAVQVHHGVSNALDAWRTRLMAVAVGAFHRVRSRARERLGLSCGIRGNGWCVTHALLERVPYQAFTLTEDIEYGIDLGLAGVRVHYADEAASNSVVVSRAVDATSQRRRWESGRWHLIRTRLPALMSRGTGPRRVRLDLAADLLVLPLSEIVLNVVLLAGTAALLGLWWQEALAWLWVALACAIALAAYVLRGWQLSGVGPRALLDLAAAPFFVVWKLAVKLRSRAPTGWVRTTRDDR